MKDDADGFKKKTCAHIYSQYNRLNDVEIITTTNANKDFTLSLNSLVQWSAMSVRVCPFNS